MSTSCCGQKPTKPNQTFNQINMTQKELSNEIYNYMDSALKSAGIQMRFTTPQINDIVNYHNRYYGTSASPHNLQDCKQCITNLKALYHTIRRNEQVYIEPSIEDIKESETEGLIEEEKTKLEVAEEEVKEYINPNLNKDEPRFCEVCGTGLHRFAKGTICKKCK
jgi:hypothetical protein